MGLLNFAPKLMSELLLLVLLKIVGEEVEIQKNERGIKLVTGDRLLLAREEEPKIFFGSRSINRNNQLTLKFGGRRNRSV